MPSRCGTAAGDSSCLAQSQAYPSSQRVSLSFICLCPVSLCVTWNTTDRLFRYESCHMKQFKRGRTEAVRFLAFCPVFVYLSHDYLSKWHTISVICTFISFSLFQIRPVSAVSTSAAGILAGKDGVDWSSSSALSPLMQQFFVDHRSEVSQCKTGNGCDRHLQGLKWRSELKNGGKADEFFASPGWAALQANQISTSQMTADGIQVTRHCIELLHCWCVGLCLWRTHDAGCSLLGLVPFIRRDSELVIALMRIIADVWSPLSGEVFEWKC